MAQHVTVFTGGAHIVSHSSRDIRNTDGEGLLVYIHCSDTSVSGSVVFSIEGKDPPSGGYFTLLQSAAIVASGDTVLRVHPDLTAASNLVAKDVLPAIWRVKAEHATNDLVTYSVGASIV